MSATDSFHNRGLQACPGCVVGSAAARSAGEGADGPAHPDQILLSLPEIHCAACISTVEGALRRHPGVTDARVNLTLKRARIVADPNVTAAELITLLGKTGYEAHELDSGMLSATTADKAGRDLLMRVGVAGFASMNVMLLSVAVWSGAEDATRDLFHWISAAIALPAIAFCAQPFFRHAWSALRHGRMNMDVPIVLAILLAAGTSLYETAHSGEHAYFDAALALTFFLLAGRYLDHRTRAVARSAAEELAALEVPRADRRGADGAIDSVPLCEVAVGDLLVVRPGGRMPVDGVIVAGQSELDRSLLTGESAPVQAAPGQAVSAGEVNLTGPLDVRATAVGADSSLHALADLVAVAESGRSKYTSLADRAARLYAPGVHILAGLSLLGWYLGTGDLRVALNIAAAVLIITCPCALGLAVPAVTTAASGRLFRAGLLIKHATALERLAKTDTVVFDKTGTLTEGMPQLDEADVRAPVHLAVARAMAEATAHPLAKALAKAAEAAGIAAAPVTDLVERPGFGVEGRYRGDQVRLGRADWVGALDPEPAATRTATWLRVGSSDPVRFAFTDRLRPGAAEAVAAFEAQGVDVHLLSGDSPAVVGALARRLGITSWQARALPADKAAVIASLRDDGRTVLMVGDGLNDTAALAAADVSISPASALDAARVASDVVLLGQGLAALPDARDTSIRAVRRIRENFRIATVYNLLAVPLAVAGLATPLIAALAMSTSSITVSLNALRLGDVHRRKAVAPGGDDAAHPVPA